MNNKIKPGVCYNTQGLSFENHLKVGHILIIMGAQFGDFPLGREEYEKKAFFGWNETYNDIRYAEFRHEISHYHEENPFDVLSRDASTILRPGAYIGTDELSESSYHAVAKKFINEGCRRGEYPLATTFKHYAYFGWDPVTNSLSHYIDRVTLPPSSFEMFIEDVMYN